MTVLITLKVKGDVDRFRASLTERAADFEATGKRSQPAGAIHHRFALGEGFVLVVDEWETLEQFEAFFGDPELQKFIGEIGADMSSPPEMTVAEAVTSADEF
jgi:quinol monooxygenase YgiN